VQWKTLHGVYMNMPAMVAQPMVEEEAVAAILPPALLMTTHPYKLYVEHEVHACYLQCLLVKVC
jgi:hypothetical protein